MKLQYTPLHEFPVLARTVGVKKLFIKREDLNPSGSHKDRALFPLVDKLAAEGMRQFCLSSSGNLAISAAYYARQNTEVAFHLFLPQSLPREKLDRLNLLTIQPCNNVKLHWSKAPKTDAIRFSQAKKLRLLRGSTEDGMLEGYHRLAQELIEQIPPHPPLGKGGREGRGGCIFMAVSSGTMALGIWRGLKKLKTSGSQLPRIHIVQTTKVHPIASAFDHDFTATKTSLATAIVDRVAHRRELVIQMVKESGGGGWVVSDEEITNAKSKITKLPDIGEVSYENAMALAGMMKATNTEFQISGPSVLVFTGK